MSRIPNLNKTAKVKRKDLINALIADTWFKHGDLKGLDGMSENAFNNRLRGLRVGKTKKTSAVESRGLGNKSINTYWFYMTQDDIDSIPKTESCKRKEQANNRLEVKSTKDKMFNLFMTGSKV